MKKITTVRVITVRNHADHAFRLTKNGTFLDCGQFAKKLTLP